MQFVSPVKGFKSRKAAMSHLREYTDGIEVETLNDIRGMILGNEDGTFTPCVMLAGRATTFARYFAEHRIYAIG